MYVQNCISVVEADTDSTDSSQIVADALFTSQLLSSSVSALSTDETSFALDSEVLSPRSHLERLILQTTSPLRGRLDKHSLLRTAYSSQTLMIRSGYSMTDALIRLLAIGQIPVQVPGWTPNVGAGFRISDNLLQ
jgi:hypothetical protein